MSRHHFLEPVDTLFLRGNRPFGDPGSYGESLVPPWPSVAAGALRSRIFAEAGQAPVQAAQFRLLDFQLARRSGEGVIEPLYSLPADLVASCDESGQWHLDRLRPRPLPAGIDGSAALAQLPLLASDERRKPQAGVWLNKAGWGQYLAGNVPDPSTVTTSGELWQLDERVGVGLDAATRRADDGKLFSMQAICFADDVGFLTESDGSAEVPAPCMLRLGGDGRGAHAERVEPGLPGGPSAEALLQVGALRIILSSPGLFPDGWRMPGMAADGTWELHGVRGRVVAAAVPGFGVVSGWDMLKRAPKPAQRVVPTGSVYWVEALEGTPEALRKLAAHGLWGPDGDNDPRRPEGYNRFHFGAGDV